MARYQKPTAEERAARDESRREDLAQKLIDAVKAIQSSADFIKLLQWQSAFYKYSARNCLLILAQRPDAQRVAGFNRWKALGRSVVKGAKGIMIYAPRLKKAEQDGDEPSIFFGIEHVFDMSDTDGEAPPALDCPDLDGPASQEAYDRLCAYTRQEGLTLISTPDQPTSAKGYYSPRQKRIYVEPASPAMMLSVLAHELAHHLDRENGASREEQETIAEGAAHVFCAHFGLDTSPSSYPYIAGWSTTEGGEKTILKCLETIQRIAKHLIEAASPSAAPESATHPPEQPAGVSAQPA